MKNRLIPYLGVLNMVFTIAYIIGDMIAYVIQVGNTKNGTNFAPFPICIMYALLVINGKQLTFLVEFELKVIR